MPNIGQDQIIATYEAAKLVHDRRVNATHAASELLAKHGMNAGSAKNYMNVFGRLIRGEVYKRTLNLEATRYFFARIADDYGQSGLSSALEATRRHIAYLDKRGAGARPGLRAVVAEFERRTKVEQLESFEKCLRAAVERSLKDTADARERRMEAAAVLPRRVQVQSWQFDRNPDVIATVLLRARGVCERCSAPAPFIRRSDGTPYLEVHHRVQLAHGGEDSVANAFALCPNCHRFEHFGPVGASSYR